MTTGINYLIKKKLLFYEAQTHKKSSSLNVKLQSIRPVPREVRTDPQQQTTDGVAGTPLRQVQVPHLQNVARCTHAAEFYEIPQIFGDQNCLCVRLLCPDIIFFQDITWEF